MLRGLPHTCSLYITDVVFGTWRESGRERNVAFHAMGLFRLAVGRLREHGLTTGRGRMANKYHEGIMKRFFP